MMNGIEDGWVASLLSGKGQLSDPRRDLVWEGDSCSKLMPAPPLPRQFSIIVEAAGLPDFPISVEANFCCEENALIL